MDVAVLFLVFNRPDNSKIVINEIAKVKPSRLYIAADGPRNNVVTDTERCQLTRKIILSAINWPCEVITLFRDKNLGCGVAVQGAIDWFFTHETEGIILEDDTVPTDNFFPYCAYMLNRYRNNTKIFSINGCSLGFENPNVSFGKTNIFNMWGWATWKRSNDLVKSTWPLFQTSPNIYLHKSVLKSLKMPVLWSHKNWFRYWDSIFFKTNEGLINTWDYQWVFTALYNKAHIIVPSANYITNIGFDSSGTHTTESKHQLSSMEVKETPISFEKFDECIPKFNSLYQIKYIAAKWANYNFYEKSKTGQIIRFIQNRIKKIT